MKGVSPESTAKFTAFWSTMVQATYAYLGTELIGITVAEAQNPRRTIPRAIKLTFFRIMLFYVVSVFLLGMLVPYDSPDLTFATKAKTSSEASPFVVAIKTAGVPILPGIVNACILIFVFSASNSDLYIASRTAYGLAKQGKAPEFLGITDARGVPVAALGVSGLIALIAFMACSEDARTVFKYFVDLVTVFGLLTWISILITHIRFIGARRRQGVADEVLPYKAPLGRIGSYGAFLFTCLVTFFKGFTAFVPAWDYKSFITGYLGVPLFFFLYVGYRIINKTRVIPPDQADLFTGKAEIDEDEEKFVAEQRARKAALKGNAKTWNTVYEKGLGWLF